MAAAEAGIAASPGQVSPILIAIGANDVFAAANACGSLTNQCFQKLLPQVLANLSTNYGQILARLRKAAPNAEIIALGLYNPFFTVDPSNSLATAVNQIIQQAAQANRARFADSLPAFNLTAPQPATLCALSFICTAGDIHPTDQGYQVISNIMWDASDYKRFEH
jgi:lysophospholipase L1-like esterase